VISTIALLDLCVLGSAVDVFELVGRVSRREAIYTGEHAPFEVLSSLLPVTQRSQSAIVEAERKEEGLFRTGGRAWQDIRQVPNTGIVRK